VARTVRELQDIARTMGRIFLEALEQANNGQPLGFSIMLFELGKTDSLVWVSNAQRDDMIDALEAQLEQLERERESLH
jgi:hypothetical protein